MFTYQESLEGVGALAKRLNISPRMCIMLKAIEAQDVLGDEEITGDARYKMLCPVLKPQTLNAFALAHDADAEEVARVNCYDAEACLYPGQTLIIPRDNDTENAYFFHALPPVSRRILSSTQIIDG